MIVKRFRGKVYVFFGRYGKRTKAQSIAKKLRNMGKSALVETINEHNHDVYVRG